MPNSLGTHATLPLDGHDYGFYSLPAAAKQFPEINRLPFSLRILLENLLRTEDGRAVTAGDVAALATWKPAAEPDREIAFTPARVLLQDFTGVPAVVDLAAMRDAMKKMGGDPTKINPLQPVELVIDHSVQVDNYGTPEALGLNAQIEYGRNQERYVFLRWGQKALRNFRVVPPDTGIVHQVNLEYLARVVFIDDPAKPVPELYPDTLVGTDSHTTMINGLGVLGWGVGGIEAEAAMLGQPVSMLIPQVVGFRLFGRLPQGATATDLVLTVTQMLRKRGVVGKFVEFYGEGLPSLPLADRATIANMAPEYGATCGIFPVDAETLRYLRLTGRPESQVRRVEAYMKEQGLFHTAATPAAVYSDTLELDLGSVVPSLAGPSRPQDRVPLTKVASNFRESLNTILTRGGKSPASEADLCAKVKVNFDGAEADLGHGSVAIAAITSCTNTSNPSVMIAAGLLAKKAVERGLKAKPWVKTSLAPGSLAVTEYLAKSGLAGPLEELGFFTVGYGCTTCIGNSGPLPTQMSWALKEKDLVVAAVLSGNRNFEGRVHNDVRANYLASPPLVVAYALLGCVADDLATQPLGTGRDGKAVYLHDVWPSQEEVAQVIEQCVRAEMFEKVYGSVFHGDDRWNALAVPEGDLYQWDANSTYVKNPPYFDGMTKTPDPVTDITGARVLALLGDSITTDHISPAGTIKVQSPAGQYLISHKVDPVDFNSYGSRRGNHEVMMRGTFANVRLKNQLVPGVEGAVTRHLPDGKQTSIYEAAMQYKAEGVPLVILAGKEYGSGSSRDWAAKGPRLLGVRAAIAESYERIHRSNLVGMGVLPLQFRAGESAASLKLTGEEVYDIEGLVSLIATSFAGGREVTVRATAADGSAKAFRAVVRIDTPQEVLYYQHGGILQYVLRQLLAQK